jgi:peptidoglycan/xylan/chitin deacetylase (PgdA/CDA1 family)
VILCYHRVAELDSDPQQLAVTRRHFSEQLKAVRELADVVSLSTLVRDLTSGTATSRRVVVTFDDGYADNLLHAKPILEQQDISATVFVTSGYVGGGREFWWDELERILLEPGALPPSLELTVAGTTRSWELGEETGYSPATLRRHPSWSVADRNDPTARHRVYRSLLRLLRPLSHEEQQGALERLREWSGSHEARPSHRTLTGEELAELGRDGLVDLGAHTVTHPVLAELPKARQQEEIAGSKTQVGDLAEIEVRHFAYPYGGSSRIRRLLSPRAPSRRPDFTAATVALVRDSGFSAACSTASGTVDRGTNALTLPRLLVRDWDGDGIARRVRELLAV